MSSALDCLTVRIGGSANRFAFSKLQWADPINGSPPQSSVCIDREASRLQQAPSANRRPEALRSWPT